VSVFFPAGVQSLGKDTWIWMATVASQTAVTVAETAAASAVIIQLALRPGFGITAETPKIDDKRHGSNILYQSFGATKREFADAVFIDRPQSAPADATRKHMDQITEGTAGYLLNRRGFGSASENWVAVASTQRYWLIPATAGPQTPIAPDSDGDQFTYTQSFIATGPLVFGVIA